MNKKQSLSSKQLSDVIIHGMQEKKANDIVLIDLRKIHNAVTDFFVICSGNSDTQLDAIADSVEEEVRKAGESSPWHNEGKKNKEWILLDYINVVVHIFKNESREFYDIESLWGDGIVTEINEEINA